MCSAPGRPKDAAGRRSSRASADRAGCGAVIRGVGPGDALVTGAGGAADRLDHRGASTPLVFDDAAEFDRGLARPRDQLEAAPALAHAAPGPNEHEAGRSRPGEVRPVFGGAV